MFSARCVISEALKLVGRRAEVRATVVTFDVSIDVGHDAELEFFEEEDGKRIKVNPLATWDTGTLARAFVERDLPRHPLAAQGYPSIGCAPCTAKPGAVEGCDAAGARAGRWPGSDKTECGIHKAPWADRATIKSL